MCAAFPACLSDPGESIKVEVVLCALLDDLESIQLPSFAARGWVLTGE